MKNCGIKLTGSILTITTNITRDFGKEPSGKSIIVASTEGYVPIPKKDDVKIGINVYKKV